MRFQPSPHTGLPQSGVYDGPIPGFGVVAFHGLLDWIAFLLALGRPFPLRAGFLPSRGRSRT